MLVVYAVGFIILNIIITILICGYMNQKSADLLMKYYYEDKKENERRLIIIEHNLNKCS